MTDSAIEVKNDILFLKIDQLRFPAAVSPYPIITAHSSQFALEARSKLSKGKRERIACVNAFLGNKHVSRNTVLAELWPPPFCIPAKSRHVQDVGYRFEWSCVNLARDSRNSK